MTHACNWRCCFGCLCEKVEQNDDSPSLNSKHTVKKVTDIYLKNNYYINRPSQIVITNVVDLTSHDSNKSEVLVDHLEARELEDKGPKTSS